MGRYRFDVSYSDRNQFEEYVGQLTGKPVLYSMSTGTSGAPRIYTYIIGLEEEEASLVMLSCKIQMVEDITNWTFEKAISETLLHHCPSL